MEGCGRLCAHLALPMPRILLFLRGWYQIAFAENSRAQGMTETLLRFPASQRDTTRLGEHRICAGIRSVRLSSVSEAILRRDVRGNRKVFLSHMTGSFVDRNPIAAWERRSDVTELQTFGGVARNYGSRSAPFCRNQIFGKPQHNRRFFTRLPVRSCAPP